jgi:hypothetical protein
MHVLQLIGSEGHFELPWQGELRTVFLVASPMPLSVLMDPRPPNLAETEILPTREFLLYRRTRDGAIYIEKDAWPA